MTFSHRIDKSYDKKRWRVFRLKKGRRPQRGTSAEEKYAQSMRMVRLTKWGRLRSLRLPLKLNPWWRLRNRPAFQRECAVSVCVYSTRVLKTRTTVDTVAP